MGQGRCLLDRVPQHISAPLLCNNCNPLERGLAWETQVMPMAGRTHRGFSQLAKVYVNVGIGLVYVKLMAR